MAIGLVQGSLIFMNESVLMTKKLYLNDPYLQNCSAEIVEQTQVHSKPGIILDQTVFFPASGGQPHDTGWVNGVEVIDVLEVQNQQIVHLLEKPLIGSQVVCGISWEMRRRPTAASLGRWLSCGKT
jgi:alanyl-tRNA synthetase